MQYTHEQLLSAIADILDFDTTPNYEDALKAYNWCLQNNYIEPIKEIKENVEKNSSTINNSSNNIAIRDRFAISGLYSANDRFFAGIDAETVLMKIYDKYPQLEWGNYGEKWLLKVDTKEVEEILWFKKVLERGGYSPALGKVIPATIEIVYQKTKNNVPVATKVKVANEIASDNHDLQSQATQGFRSSNKISVLDWDYDKYTIIEINQELPYYEEKWESSKKVIVLRQYNEYYLFHKWWYNYHKDSFNKYWTNYNNYLLKSWNNKTTTEDHELQHKMYLLRSTFERKYGNLKHSIIPTRVIELKRQEAQDHQLGFPTRVKKAKSKISSGGGNPDIFSTNSAGKHQPTLEQAYRGRYYKDEKGVKYQIKLDDSKSMVWAIWPHKAMIVAKLERIGNNNIRPIYTFSITDKHSALLAEHINSFLGIGKEKNNRNNTQAEIACIVTEMRDFVDTADTKNTKMSKEQRKMILKEEVKKARKRMEFIKQNRKKM